MENLLSILYLILHLTVTISIQTCQKEDTTLTCYLRTLQPTDMKSAISEKDRDILSSAKKLHVKCSDVFFFESQLKSEHFGSLPELEYLDIEFCKIRNIPQRAFAGLRNLKSLSLQSHNSEWTSIILEVDANGFQKINTLESLNLAHNNLYGLPDDALCGLSSLTRLNLSQNHFLDVADIGLSNPDRCYVALEELDLSNNYISSLPANALQQATKLKTLKIEGNRLSIVDDQALKHLPVLETVDFSNNQLAALPPKLFNESQQLRKLLLQNNSLSLITADLFKGLKNLTLLDLSHNSISTHLLSPDTFQGLESLEILDLSHNKLTRLEVYTFATLSALQVLNLAYNQVHVMSSRTFISNPILKIIVFSHNELDQIPEDTLKGLNALESLSLDHNNIKELYIDTPLPSLTDLALNNNNISNIPSFIQDSKELKTIDIGDNSIKTLSQKSGFNQLPKLYGLRLEGNAIEFIANDTFSIAENQTQTSSLNVLNLAKNKLNSLSPGTFKSLQKLRALRLDSNALEDINGVVSSLSNLEWFNVSANQIEWFDYAFLPSNISWLDISSNNIGQLENFYQLKASGFPKLQTIDASKNLISSVNENTFSPVAKSLKNLRLNENIINDISPNTFTKLKAIKDIELKSNQIQHLKKEALSTSFMSYEDNAIGASIHLSGNPFICDCKLDWLQDVNGNIKPYQSNTLTRRRQHQHRHMKVVDIADVTCKQLDDNKELLTKVSKVPRSNFMCPYKTHCFDLCRCCDFYACDCRMQCPHGCDCTHDASWSRNIITCSAKNHTAVPLLIPMDATHVYLDGNDLRHSVVQQNFLGRHRVQHMYLNNSNIFTLQNNTFSGLIGIRTLHLQDNMLGSIGYGGELDTLIKLEELYLQNNQIRSIATTAFDSLRSLRILRLDANLLTSFQIWDALPMPASSMRSISLAQNMWSCECDFLTMFNHFLEENIGSISDYDSVQCVSNNDLVMGAGENCSPREILPSGHQNIPMVPENLNLVTILVPALVAVIMLILGILAVCVFRQGIKNWLYNHGSVCNKSSIYGGSMEPQSDLSSSGESSNASGNKLFDVYVSYCAEDSEFVDTTLAPTLEHGGNTQISPAGSSPTYRVCLQRRDFPANANFEQTVVVATESSARVLIVMSKRYLSTEWQNFKIPLQRAVSNQSEGKVIILLLEDLTSVNDIELAQYLRMCPTIKWGEAGFLNKLRFFLPEPAFMTFQRNITLRTLKSSASSAPQHFFPAVGTDVLRKKKIPRFQSQVAYSETPISIHSGHPQLGYASCHSEHTYHSIPDDNNHIYHTLEPSLLNQQSQNYQRQEHHMAINTGVPKNFQIINDLNRTSSPNAANARAVFLNKNLDLVLKVDPPRNSLSPVLPAVCHSYTQSSSSGQQLLPNVSTKSSNNTEEYIV